MPQEFIPDDAAARERRISRQLALARDSRGQPLWPDLNVPGSPAFNQKAQLIEVDALFTRRINTLFSGISPLTSEGAQLDDLGQRFSRPRVEALPATGTIEVVSQLSGEALERLYGSRSIPRGTRLEAGTVRLRTLADAIIAPSEQRTTVEVAAERAGANVRVPAGSRIEGQISEALRQVLRFTTTNDIAGGKARESDEQYRFRLLGYFTDPGSAEGYLLRILGHAGVAEANVVSNVYGPGTLEAFVLPSTSLPTSTLRAEIETLWTGRGGAYVIFPDYEAVVLRIRTTGAADPGVVVDYINNLGIGDTLVVEQIESRLIQAGVTDAQVVGLRRGRVGTDGLPLEIRTLEQITNLTPLSARSKWFSRADWVTFCS